MLTYPEYSHSLQHDVGQRSGGEGWNGISAVGLTPVVENVEPGRLRGLWSEGRYHWSITARMVTAAPSYLRLRSDLYPPRALNAQAAKDTCACGGKR